MQNVDHRLLGFLVIELTDEFFDPLPEDELQAWESESE